MKDNIAILNPGKGWGNFVTHMSCYKTISEVRNKKITVITKKFSSAPSYLSDQNFVDKFIESLIEKIPLAISCSILANKS